MPISITFSEIEILIIRKYTCNSRVRLELIAGLSQSALCNDTSAIGADGTVYIGSWDNGLCSQGRPQRPRQKPVAHAWAERPTHGSCTEEIGNLQLPAGASVWRGCLTIWKNILKISEITRIWTASPASGATFVLEFSAVYCAAPQFLFNPKQLIVFGGAVTAAK